MQTFRPDGDDGDDGDDTLQKEVEEEDGGRAAEQAVEHQEDFSSDGGRSGHPKPWETQTLCMRRNPHGDT